MAATAIIAAPTIHRGDAAIGNADRPTMILCLERGQKDSSGTRTHSFRVKQQIAAEIDPTESHDNQHDLRKKLHWWKSRPREILVTSESICNHKLHHIYNAPRIGFFAQIDRAALLTASAAGRDTREGHRERLHSSCLPPQHSRCSS